MFLIKNVIRWVFSRGPFAHIPLTKKERIIAKACRTRGYTSTLKLGTLYQLCQTTGDLPGDILEIGSAFGRSTIVLALSSKKQIWSIDPHWGENYGDRKVGCERSSYQEFINNLKKNRVLHRVNVVRSITEEVINKGAVPPQTIFSLAFIDGLHTAAAVETDFSFAYPRVMKYGIIVFDDYFEPSVADYAKKIDNLVLEAGETLNRDTKTGLVWFKKTKEFCPSSAP